MTWTVAGFGVLLVVLGIAALYYVPKAKEALAAGRAAVTAAKKVPNDLSAQNFPVASQHVNDTLTALQDTKIALDKMQGLKAWPYVGRQFTTVQKLLDVGDQSVQAMGTLVVFLKQRLPHSKAEEK